MTDITLPRLGETMEEARVTEWLVAPGQDFARGDVLMEVETDKTVVEVPALVAGHMVEHLAEIGAQVEIGQPIARIETEGADTTQPSAAQTPAHAPEAVQSAEPPVPRSVPPSAPPPVPAPAPATPPEIAGNRDHPRPPASPPARRKAHRAGVALDGIRGTGRRGRITLADVDAATQAPAGESGRVAVAGGAVVFDRIPPTGTSHRAPVVLLHGLFADMASWRELPRQIAARGHEVIVPDMPGHGDSAMPLADMEAFLAATRAFVDAVLPDGPVILVGHSLGAYSAAHLAMALGDRLQRLLLIAPLGLGARIPRDFLETMTEARSPEALARGLRWLGHGADRLSPAGLAQELARAEAERDIRRMLIETVAARGVQQLALAETLAPVAERTVAIFGLDDRLIDWRDAAALPGDVAVHFIHDAGHLPQLTAGGLILRLLD